MKLIGWALAIAAAGLTPATAAAQSAAEPTATETAAAEPNSDPAANDVATLPALQPGESGDPATTAEAAAAYEHIPAEAGVGHPTGGRGIHEQVTEVGQYAAGFHNNWLLPLCAIISLFVLGLLAYTIVRYRRGKHPEPSRTSHNTALEVVWTLVPVLILVAIAIPSMRLLAKQYSPPPADVTIKVIGNQWYWTYQYPDHGDVEIVSNMLKEQGDVGPGERYRTDADGPPLLAVDERLVIPAGKVVKFIVTSNDVIHSFGVPAFWTKMDANPGRLNETWVKVDKPGVYFGNCYELCGARHAYMPIAVEVVPEARFAAWVASKGGTMPGAGATPAAVPEAQRGSGPAEASDEREGDDRLTPDTTASGATPETQPTTNQAATAQN